VSDSKRARERVLSVTGATFVTHFEQRRALKKDEVTNVPGGVEGPGCDKGEIKHRRDLLSLKQDVERSNKSDEPKGDEEAEVHATPSEPGKEVEPLNQVPQQREKEEDPQIQAVSIGKVLGTAYPE